MYIHLYTYAYMHMYKYVCAHDIYILYVRHLALGRRLCAYFCVCVCEKRGSMCERERDRRAAALSVPLTPPVAVCVAVCDAVCVAVCGAVPCSVSHFERETDARQL